MNKSFYLLIVAVFASIFAFTSCEETKEVDTSVVWRDANQKFIDSIATVARANADGKWKVMKAWNLPPDVGLSPSSNISYDVQQYVYAKVLKEGNGSGPALFTDTAYVNYQGRYYNGKIFDSTYPSSDINPETSRTTMFAINATGLRVGFATALQYMHVGDRWEVYIPWMLGYGTTDYGSIPAYSDLVFDLDLVKIVTPEGKERAKH